MCVLVTYKVGFKWSIRPKQDDDLIVGFIWTGTEFEAFDEADDAEDWCTEAKDPVSIALDMLSRALLTQRRP